MAPERVKVLATMIAPNDVDEFIKCSRQFELFLKNLGIRRQGGSVVEDKITFYGSADPKINIDFVRTELEKTFPEGNIKIEIAL